MAAVWILSSEHDEELIALLKRRIEASGRVVHVATQDIECRDPSLPTIVAWSPHSTDWGPVRKMARLAAACGSLIPIALSPVRPPVTVSSAPLDFSKWRGEGGSTLRMLIDRIERVERSAHDAPVQRNHFLPTLAMVAGSLTVIGFAQMLRAEDGPLPINLQHAAPAITSADAGVPNVSGSAGGPEYLSPVLELDVVVDSIDPPRAIGAPRYIQLSSINEPLPLIDVALRRESILGQILRAPTEILRAPADLLRAASTEL
ncbi:MAG: hypothetical protein JNJ73_02830 [Hyphomonadaceae bacterium]|nr:hypothetical protein [Hyphomonadaceae bacterium]